MVFPLSKQTGRRLDTEESSVMLTDWLRPPTALSEAPEWSLFWQEMGASVIRTLEFKIQLLDELYIFRRSMEVMSFIEDHPLLVPLLEEAYINIVRYFGPYPHVFLEVISDPEATNDRQLFAFIGTHLSPDQALNSLERFDEEWWLDVLDQAQGKLCIDIEFL
jgi:hypothetical protein